MNLGLDPGNRPLFGMSLLSALSSAAARMMFGAAAAFNMVLFCAAGVAGAHGGGPGLMHDRCMQQVGADDFVHLAIYQPDFNPFAEYCEALPRAGSTMLVFDLMGTELPVAPVSFELLQKGARFNLSVPSRRYRSGVIDLRADLPPGSYTVFVNVDQRYGRRRLAFPLTVGARWAGLMMPIVIILLIGATSAGYCLFQVRCIALERGHSKNGRSHGVATCFETLERKASVPI